MQDAQLTSMSMTLAVGSDSAYTCPDVHTELSSVPDLNEGKLIHSAMAEFCC
jgi:hypothetical protein